MPATRPPFRVETESTESSGERTCRAKTRMSYFSPFFARKTNRSRSPALPIVPFKATGGVNAFAVAGDVVGLMLDRVAERAEPEGVGERGHAVIVLGEQAEVAIEGLRQGQACGHLTEHVADPAHVERLTDLAAGGDRRRGPGEIADVQAIRRSSHSPRRRPRAPR